jgi:hypothetical protein
MDDDLTAHTSRHPAAVCPNRFAFLTGLALKASGGLRYPLHHALTPWARMGIVAALAASLKEAPHQKCRRRHNSASS